MHALHVQDGNLILYDGTGHPVYYSSTFQSSVGQPGARLGLVADATAVGGKVYNYAQPIYRATFCVTATNGTCYRAGYIGQQLADYFRQPNYRRSFSDQPAPIGSTILDYDASILSLATESFQDQVTEVRPATPQCMQTSDLLAQEASRLG